MARSRSGRSVLPTRSGPRTVAVFPHEDRWSEHRLKADEAYEIGERGHPVRAYLDPEAIVAVAVKAGADAIYPGYGFLSENPALAEACANAGITFIGPTADVLDADRQQGPRDRRGQGRRRADAGERRAGHRRRRAGRRRRRTCPTRCSSRPSPAAAAAACAGSTTRRSCARRSRPACARARAPSATRPSSSSRPWSSPRHIEVQILADGEGNVIHLFERDCSVQRRHQKVVEIAPAPNLDPELRERMCADAVRFADARSATATPAPSSSCSTPTGNYVFIEMNPRIQVEHTVTEEVTDVDLVQSQMRIAVRRDPGRPRALPGHRAAARRRAAVPDHHRGPRQRLPPRHRRRSRPTAPPAAPASASTAARPTPAPRSRAHFDSMLAKLTCRGRTFEKAVEKARRAVAEFRIRGVSTNIPFLQARARRPRLRRRPRHHVVHRDPPAAADRARLRRPRHQAADLPGRRHRQPAARAGAGRASTRSTKLPDVNLDVPAPDGTRQLLLEVGPEEFARRLRAQNDGRRHRHHVPRRPPVAARDPGPHPRPARGRRSRRPHDAAAVVARGLGRRDVRRGAALPRRGPVGAAGRAAPGRAQHLPADAAARPQHGRLHAVPDRGHRRLRRGGGRDRHRRVPDLRRAQRRRADAARDRGRARHRHHRRRGGALLHRRPVATPTRRSTRSTTTSRLAERIVDAGAHVLAIKDMAGLLRAPAARTLVTALRERVRPARAPAHPRHPRRPAGHAARRDRRRGRRRRRRLRVDGRHHLAARRCRRWSRPPTTRPARPGSRWPPSTRSSPTGRRPAASTRRSSRGCPRRPAASTATRSPAASSPTCASRRSRSAWARSSSRSRTCTPPPTTSSATSSR